MSVPCQQRPVVARGFCLALATLLTGSSSPANAGDCTPPAEATNTVAKIVDAETLLLDNGRQVRLVGALAPRVPLGLDVTPGAWPPEAATRENLERLTLGKPIALVFVGRHQDRYGRLQAQVFLGSGNDAAWVQRELVAGGLARAYALPGTGVCLAQLVKAESDARTTGLGLWSHPSYRPRAATDLDGLMSLLSAFAIVEGRVVSVATRGKRAYLNFGQDWRRDFTVVVPPQLLRANPPWADSLAGLAGRAVRVRGWIEKRNGPAIEISDTSEIEVDAEASSGEVDTGSSYEMR